MLLRVSRYGSFTKEQMRLIVVRYDTFHSLPNAILVMKCRISIAHTPHNLSRQGIFTNVQIATKETP